MPRLNPLVASIATALALGVVQHAAATTPIEVNINDLENASDLSSNEAAGIVGEGA
ncbi:hypothetical protein [Thiohalocapsa sp. ML1]|jgi:hypothetical protein|uniref:hypothetical protein n=1 Tax=Thiohalocapsa sp. ML1 TaxID=1431688 RepID=UPI0012E3AAF8|nr:hypothetical protein [Thiohalocapsa sp. ML1]